MKTFKDEMVFYLQENKMEDVERWVAGFVIFANKLGMKVVDIINDPEKQEVKLVLKGTKIQWARFYYQIILCKDEVKGSHIKCIKMFTKIFFKKFIMK